MSDNIFSYCKQLVLNHVLIIILCLFLVVYIVINYNLIKEGDIYSGNLPKTFIITGVIFLILYIVLILDNEEQIHELEEQEVYLPKYKIINKNNILENNQINSLKPIQEFKINTKLNNKYNKINSDIQQDNSNIFISNKNKAKFGIKF